MSDILNTFWHIPAEENGDDNIAVALTSYFESLPDCPDDAPINDEHGWTDFAMDRFESLDKRITEHFKPYESLATKLQEAERRLDEIAKAIHYPDCWDTMAYPTLLDAISEINHCTTCEALKGSN